MQDLVVLNQGSKGESNSRLQKIRSSVFSRPELNLLEGQKLQVQPDALWALQPSWQEVHLLLPSRREFSLGQQVGQG